MHQNSSSCIRQSGLEKELHDVTQALLDAAEWSALGVEVEWNEEWREDSLE